MKRLGFLALFLGILGLFQGAFGAEEGAISNEYTLREELVETVRNGNMEDFNRLLRAMINRGYDINSTRGTGSGYNPLMMAAEKNNVDVIRNLLALPTINVNKMAGVDGLNALMIAAKNGSKEAIQELLKSSKIGVNMVSNALHGSALMIAAKNGFPEIVQLLLNAGADPLQDSGAGTTAVDVAATEEIKKILKDWIEARRKETEDALLMVTPLPKDVTGLITEFVYGEPEK